MRWLQVTQQIASGNSIDAGSGSTDPLTEAKILECHQAVFEAGGDPTVLMVKPSDATIVSGFTAASGRQRTFNDDTDAHGNGGHPREQLRHSECSDQPPPAVDPCVPPRSVDVAHLRPSSVLTDAAAKTNDADRHFIVGELTLKHMNFSADGMVTGLS